MSYFRLGQQIKRDRYFIEGDLKTREEISKEGTRTEVINLLLSTFKRPTTYLEIGLRNPASNYRKIKSGEKFSVDPGYESKLNFADFHCTSNAFFEGIPNRKWPGIPEKFDLIFIDGLHSASQVDQDISNSLGILSEDGFLVVHDCNPPTQWHSREEYDFLYSPAKFFWNGTTWKAFLKWRGNPSLFSCCVDTDWGVGIFSRKVKLGLPLEKPLEFYDYKEFDGNRKYLLNLISFKEFKELIKQG